MLVLVLSACALRFTSPFFYSTVKKLHFFFPFCGHRPCDLWIIGSGVCCCSGTSGSPPLIPPLLYDIGQDNARPVPNEKPRPIFAQRISLGQISLRLIAGE